MTKTFDFLGVAVPKRFEDDSRRTALYVEGFLRGEYQLAMREGNNGLHFREIFAASKPTQKTPAEQSVEMLGYSAGLGNSQKQETYTKRTRKVHEPDTVDLQQKMHRDFSQVPVWALPDFSENMDFYDQNNDEDGILAVFK